MTHKIFAAIMFAFCALMFGYTFFFQPENIRELVFWGVLTIINQATLYDKIRED